MSENCCVKDCSRKAVCSVQPTLSIENFTAQSLRVLVPFEKIFLRFCQECLDEFALKLGSLCRLEDEVPPLTAVLPMSNVGKCFCGRDAPVREFSHWHAADDCEEYEAAVCDDHFGGDMTDQIMSHITKETRERKRATNSCG